MPLQPTQLANRLVSEAEKTMAFFTGLDAEDWGVQVYADGADWRVDQILIHLVQAENAILRLVASILAGGQGTPQGFDLDAYNERKVAELETADPFKLLDAFQEVRIRTIAQARSLSQADLARVGRHPFLGLAPVEEMIKLLYRHTQLHQRDIRRILNGGE